MTWDSQNRMVSCVYKGVTSTFKYGADGLRRQATVNGGGGADLYEGAVLWPKFWAVRDPNDIGWQKERKGENPCALFCAF